MSDKPAAPRRRSPVITVEQAWADLEALLKQETEGGITVEQVEQARAIYETTLRAPPRGRSQILEEMEKREATDAKRAITVEQARAIHETILRQMKDPANPTLNIDPQLFREACLITMETLADDPVAIVQTSAALVAREKKEEASQRARLNASKDKFNQGLVDVWKAVLQRSDNPKVTAQTRVARFKAALEAENYRRRKAGEPALPVCENPSTVSDYRRRAEAQITSEQQS
jgi:hypothetical protein